MPQARSDKGGKNFPQAGKSFQNLRPGLWSVAGILQAHMNMAGKEAAMQGLCLPEFGPQGLSGSADFGQCRDHCAKIGAHGPGKGWTAGA